MQRWLDLPESAKREIERKYRAGKTPVDLGVEYGLKPKQISDQAYRKLWEQDRKSKNKTSRKKAVKKPEKQAKGVKKNSKKSKSSHR